MVWTLCMEPVKGWQKHQQNIGSWRGRKRKMHLRFQNSQCQMRVAWLGQSSLHTHLCRWVQTCAVQAHPRLRIENKNQTWKHEKWHTPQIFHDRAFKKLCGIMNRVHQAKRTYWDLRIPVVRWAYRAISKNYSAEVIPTLKRRDETIRADNNPPKIAPTVGTIREDPGKGIM